MGVKLQSSLGGNVELNPPSTASNYTLTVPASNGTVAITDQLINFRNRIINGDMRIDQRNAGAIVSTAVGGSGYTLDRWSIEYTQTSKFTLQQNLNSGTVTPPAGFTHHLGISSSSAYSVGVNDLFALLHRIEGFNVADLAWGTANAATITVSFWVRSSLTGNFGGSIRNNAGTRSYPYFYNISAANTWEYKTITIPGDTSGTWLKDNSIGLRLDFGLGTGGTYSGTAGAWGNGNFLSPTGAVSVVGTNGATLYITGVQLELGTVATPFERRPFGTELQLCQRYFAKTYNLEHAPGSTTGGTGGAIRITGDGAITYLSNNWCYPVAMRANPTIKVYNPNTGATPGYNFDSGNGTAITGSGNQNNAVFVIQNASVGLNVFVSVHMTAEIEL